MFGVEELEEIKKEIEDAIKIAKKADILFKSKKEELLKLLGKENLEKVAEILEM